MQRVILYINDSTTHAPSVSISDVTRLVGLVILCAIGDIICNMSFLISRFAFLYIFFWSMQYL